MTEREKEKWLDIIDDFEHNFMAIIAYGITRIADQGDQTITITTADIPKPKPAPDALVEAVALHVERANKWLTDNRFKDADIKELKSVMSDFVKRFENLLPAHEKIDKIHPQLTELVDVCQEIIEAQRGAPIEPCDDKHDKALVTITMDYDLIARLKSALADHEKAMR